MWRGATLTNEDVIRLWTSTSNLEEFHQVKELAMDVTANLFQVSQMDERSSRCDYLRLPGRLRPGHYSPRQGFPWL
jgi:hypothetical protein